MVQLLLRKGMLLERTYVHSRRLPLGLPAARDPVLRKDVLLGRAVFPTDGYFEGVITPPLADHTTPPLACCGRLRSPGVCVHFRVRTRRKRYKTTLD